MREYPLISISFLRFYLYLVLIVGQRRASQFPRKQRRAAITARTFSARHSRSVSFFFEFKEIGCFLHSVPTTELMRAAGVFDFFKSEVAFIGVKQ